MTSLGQHVVVTIDESGDEAEVDVRHRSWLERRSDVATVDTDPQVAARRPLGDDGLQQHIAAGHQGRVGGHGGQYHVAAAGSGRARQERSKPDGDQRGAGDGNDSLHARIVHRSVPFVITGRTQRSPR